MATLTMQRRSTQFAPRKEPHLSLIGLTICFVAVAALGCGRKPTGIGSSGPERAGVHGKVSLDGQPLASANIKFVLPTRTVGTRISNGEYRIRKDRGPLIGQYRVEISWKVPVGGFTQDESGEPIGINSNSRVADGGRGGEARIEEKIPARYNVQSELKVDIKSGDNEWDFDLASN